MSNAVVDLVPGNRPPVPRAVDPDALGKIRNIVKSAHKWGGDGRRPKFRKIRRVLLSKHPDVIARAFGGNPNVAAAWIKNNWYRMRGMAPPPTRGRKAKQLEAERDVVELEWYEETEDELGENEAELFCAIDPEDQGEDGLVWTPIFRTGQWAVNPIRGNIPEAKGPMRVDLEFLQDVVEAFNDRVFEIVPVPASKWGGPNHIDDPVDDNRGFVEAVKISDDPKREGQHLLWAGIRFTDPGTLELVQNGSVRGVSVRIKWGVRHTETGKTYRRALQHVCLTNNPFVNGLDAFRARLAATRDADEAAKELKLVSHEQDEEPDLDEDLPALLSLETGERAYDDTLDFDSVRAAIQDELRELRWDGKAIAEKEAGKEYPWEGDLTVRGVTPNQALISWYGAGDSEGWVAEYDVDDDGTVTLDQPDEWTRVQKQWVELTRFFATTDDTSDFAGLDEFEAEMSLGWIESAGVKREDLADGDFLVVVKVGDKKIRKLPYKIHGQVNEAGWRAAWNVLHGARGGVKLPAGFSKEALLERLRRAKPKGVQVSTERDDLVLVEDIIVIADSQEGGADMAENGETGEVRMTRSDLEGMIAEAIKKDREEREPVLEATREQIAQLQADNHRLDVTNRVKDLNDRKLPPAFIKKAEELMLAVGSGGEVSLTREDGDEKITFVDAIAELAATVPPGPDAEDHTPDPTKDKPHGGGKTPEEKAAEIAAELESEEVALADADLSLTT